ncbi:hypothetical protein SHJG_0496 [Streptomyces hygroscopicus subsp. jinggangensis 5008]|nr:hypothetical protein SHJG_0496 [Streptomyces hygroscopicus subsp. jinggangensis 5008]AGF59995.1 hypothetical protein SHJGH_0329 [Streptomyces hygroscopicus subsp. jinggangensis TL01]
MKSARRENARWLAVGTWAVVLGLATAGCWFSGRAGGPPSHAGDATADRVTAGRVCRSALPRGMELSCGTYGFGDLRYVCSARRHDGARCERTSQVTVRNPGRAVVYVTYLAGARPGVREEGPRQSVEPGGETTLRPGAGRLLFDITLRGTDGGPSRLEVVGVR